VRYKVDDTAHFVNKTLLPVVSSERRRVVLSSYIKEAGGDIIIL
jgi:hypothetical protein